MKIGSSDISAAYIGSTAINKVYIGSTEVWSSYSYLLDTYTGAAAAYSLRLLRSAYTGYAIKVRRASDNTEQDIGFVDNILDTSTLTSFCSGTNGFVTTWYDQSGNGYDATQSTAANQPQIISSGSVVTENGKPSLQFDGSNDNLDADNLSAVFSGIDKDLSTIAVLKTTNSVASVKVAYGFGNSSNAAPLWWFGESPSILNAGRSDLRSDAVLLNSVTGNIISSQSLFYIDNNFDDVNIYINNVFGANSNNNLAQVTLNKFAIGTFSRASKTNYWEGTIQEIVIYNSNESSNKNGLSTNINDFYSIY